MSILVVGSVAFDRITTPFGTADRCLGGSATYFSVAASFFSPVNLVAVVGEDFTDDDIAIFKGRDIDLSGLQKVKGAKTFFWAGEYGFDLNVAKTRETQLNVFADFKPRLNERQRNSDVLFLANIDPELQLDVLRQCSTPHPPSGHLLPASREKGSRARAPRPAKRGEGGRRPGEGPRIVALDTMNYWIASKKDALTRVFSEVDLIIINEAEVRQYTQEPNLVKGSRQILALGPKTLVVKRGEYGVLMVTKEAIFATPAYPLENVFDPTGAGDTFAGGFLGYLASCHQHDDRELRRAIIFGSVLASFTVEKFSLDRLREITIEDIQQRYRAFRALTHFDDFEV